MHLHTARERLSGTRADLRHAANAGSVLVGILEMNVNSVFLASFHETQIDAMLR